MHTLTQRLKGFAVEHDDMPAFHVAFLTLTLLAAAMFNIGAFVLLIATHATLDVVKYREIHSRSWRRTLQSTLRESLLDIFLLCGALVLALYLHHGSSIIALSGLMRVETSFIRGILVLAPKVEVLWHSVWIFKDCREHLFVSPEVSGSWRTSERLYAVGTMLSLALVAASFGLFGMEGVVQVLRDELIPWNF